MGIQYILYQLTSRHGKGHGIHSPFVFRLIRKVLVNEEKISVPDEITEWHRKIRSDKTVIDTTTPGEESHSAKKSEMLAGKIVRKAGVQPKYGSLLYRLVWFHKPDTIIELGTGLGISTHYLASANQAAVMVSIEGSHAKYNWAKKTD